MAAAGITKLTPSQFKAARKLLGLPSGGKTRHKVSVRRKAAHVKRSASKHTAAATNRLIRSRRAGAPGDLEPGSRWLTGMNDVLGTCAAVAVANDLLAEGFPVTDEDVLLLHLAAGGDAGGADLAEVIALAEGGFLGPEARAEPGGGDLHVVSTPTGLHVVCQAGGTAVSYGREIPWDCADPVASWSLDWLL